MLTLHPLLKRGDILVADRGFCSYAQVALLMHRGVDAVMRLHQRRPVQWMKDHLEHWERPDKRPHWMSETVWSSLPAELSVRIVRYTVAQKGYRTRVVYVATTLIDPTAYPPETIARLYGHRWNIETCFNQLKTHAKMNALKSRTAEGVTKELIMYLIVWNRGFPRSGRWSDDDGEVRGVGRGERVVRELPRRGALAVCAAATAAADGTEPADQPRPAGAVGAEKTQAASEGVRPAERAAAEPKGKASRALCLIKWRSGQGDLSRPRRERRAGQESRYRRGYKR